MSDSRDTLVDRAVAWCRDGERSDAEYLDREFAHTLVRNPLLFVAFRAGQRDRQAEIEDLKIDLRAAGDECGVLREHDATLRQAVAELKDRNRRQDRDIIDMREAIRDRDAEIESLKAKIAERDAAIRDLAAPTHVPGCRRPLTGPCECEVMTPLERAARAEIAALEAKEGARAKEIAELQADIQLMSAPHESVGAVVFALREEIAEKAKEIAALQEAAVAARVVYEARYHGVSGRKRSDQWMRLRRALDALEATDAPEENR